MQVAKLGESLAVVLPDAVAESFGLKEGDEVDIEIRSANGVTSPDAGGLGKALFERAADERQSREAALKVFDELSRPFPEGFKFDREEANAR